MVKRNSLAVTLALAGLALGVPGTAQASTGTGIGANMSLGGLPLAVAAMALNGQPAADTDCQAGAMPATGTAPLALAPAGLATSKASAILGGQVSALEAMRLQQAGEAPAVQLASAQIPGQGIVPRSGSVACARFVMPQPSFAAMRPGLGRQIGGADDFLASRRLPVSHTTFDGEWNRVRRESLPANMVSALARIAPGRPGTATLAAVNAFANSRIHYVEDQQLYGRADYWASARTSLRRGAGDCEDIAIAKLQLLAAMGVPREAMYLTIARDLVRNADHALLVVKLDGRHWLLDNNTDRLLDASESMDYRPIMSFSTTHKWLHGY